MGSLLTPKTWQKKERNFHSEWEYFFTTVKETAFVSFAGQPWRRQRGTIWRDTSLPTKATMVTTHREVRSGQKKSALNAASGKQQSFFSRKPATNAHITFSDKKAFSDGEVFKEAMMIIANAVLKDEKNGTDLISSLYDVQLGASKMTRLESAMSANLAEQLNRDLTRCRWFSIQCDESVDNSCTAQLSVFIRMVFEVLSTKEELLALLPLKTTTRVVDVYNEGKEFFIQKKVTMEK